MNELQILPFEIAYRKLSCLIGELTEEFFGKYDPTDKSHHALILYAFEHMAVYSELCIDVLRDLHTAIEQAKKEGNASA